MMSAPEDAQPSDGTLNPQKTGKKSTPDWVTGIDSRPQYRDGTPFPENFLDHETLVGYPGDKPPPNAGADAVLEIVSLFEHEGLSCCIVEVMALQYYGSERMENVRLFLH